MPTTSLSTNPNINALLSTYQWGTQNGQGITVTYSFPTTGAVWVPGYTEPTAGWSGLTAAQQASFKSALSAWSEVANIRFTQVADNQSSVGDIRVAFSNAVPQQNADGWAYPPSSASVPQAGDIWLNPNDLDFSMGTHSYETMVHEIGHALGLKHPFATTTGNDAVLPDAENNYQYSLMSYNDYPDAGLTFQSTGPNSYLYYPVQPAAPMLYDIAAIQFLYGANMSTRTGNDTYTFSNTQGELKAIWDAGGIDTFDLSNQTLEQMINLNAGQFSSLGVQKTTFDGPLSAANANIAIAYNVNIENAIGGAGNDTIIGNALNNKLTGGAGDDTITGDLGSDKLVGGTGNDSLSGGAGNDTYVVESVGDTVTESANAGIDTVQSSVNWTLGANVEKLTLLKGAFNGTGNELANTLIGNNAKNILDGGLGNDKLAGGAGSDTLIGGAGSDIFLFDSASGVDTISDFSVEFDTIQLENAVFTSLTNTGVLAVGQFTFGSLASDANDFLIYNQSSGALYYDADGNGAIAETQIAKLGVNLMLTNADFIVV